MGVPETWKVDRTVWKETTLAEQGKDRAYWMSRDPAERFAAIEMLRQVYHGYDASTARLQRLYTVIERGEG
jgi:hypothetical protein